MATKDTETSRARLVQEVEHLRSQLAEAQETLNAIRNGEVDAIVTTGEDGEKVFTLQGADYAYRVLIESMQEGAATLSDDGTILYCNQSLGQILKVPIEQLIAGSIHPFIPLQHKAAFEALFRRGLLTSSSGETELRRPDGSLVPVDLAFSCMPLGDSRPTCMVVRDLTERKRQEAVVAERTALAERRARQLQKLAAQLTHAEERERRRLAQVLHDHLQQLLVGAKFNTAILDGQLQTESKRGLLRQIDRLLDDSLEVSRSLTVELSPPILYEGQPSQAFTWLAAWMHEKHGLRVQTQVHADAEQLDEDVRVLLFQAVRELLFNVVKHARVREATVEIGPADGGRVQAVVCDAGIGFDPRETHLHSSPSSASGLGLFSIRERLELMGGRLEIQSSPGQGTRAVVALPMHLAGAGVLPRVTEPDSEVRMHARPQVGADGRPLPITRVLLAEDHVVVRDGLARLLQMQPDMAVVGQASDGQQAVEMASHAQPDVVILDVTMPVLDGMEAARRIRAQLPDVQIVCLSIHPAEEMEAPMAAAGANLYVAKTCDPEEVLTAVRTAAAAKASASKA